MSISSSSVEQFFDRYASALLARDARSVAAMYAVPGLLVFPGQTVAVSDPRQTEKFFAGSWDQYEAVDTIDRTVSTVGATPSTAWVNVTWSYAGRDQEGFCYQLVDGPDGLQIAVLTPLD